MTPSQRRLAVGGGAGALVIAWVVGAVLPQALAVAALGPKVRQLQQDLRDVRRQAAELPQWAERYDALRSELRAAPRLLVQERLPALLDQLAATAKASGLIVEVARPAGRGAADPAASEYAVIPIEILGRAGYHDVGRFVEQFEAAQPLCRVETLTIEADRRDPLRQRVTLVIRAALAVTPL